MNSEFDHWSARITRYAAPTLILFALSVPLVIFGAVGALRSTSNDPRQWLPRAFAETDKYEWFQHHFGTDEIAVVSWPGCTLDDPRVERLATSLEDSPFFDRAITGPRLLKKLTAPPLRVPSSVAIRRMRGILLGPDYRTTCIVLATSSTGKANRVAAVESIASRAATECHLADATLRLAGPTVDAAAIDSESRRLLFQLAGISAALSFFVAFWRLQSVRLAIIVLVGAIYSTGLTLAAVYFSGGKMNLLMTMLPPLIYVLSISASVHLVNYYRDALADSPLQDAAAAAIVRGWLPCMLAALTTAIGLMSLMMSKIDPIRMFGVYSAVGVMISLAVLFLFLPSALQSFPPAAKQPNGRLPTGHGAIDDVGTRLMASIGRHYVAVMLGCLILMGYCGWGLTRVDSTVKLQDRFLASSKVIGDYRWLEEHVGPMVPVEVVIRFDRTCSLDFLQRMVLVADIQRAIQSLPQGVATLSAADLNPPLPQGGGIRQVVRRRRLKQRLVDSQQSLVAAHFLAEDTHEQLWRINVRAKALGSLDYGRFTETLRRRVEPLLRGVEAQATYTGVIPLIYKAQRQLLQDLVRSFLAAFGTIAIVFAVVLRNWGAAVVAMVPNLFPAGVVFGGMGWIRIPVQIGSVMTASAALGIAVDDTIHFLSWFYHGLDRGLSRLDALRNAFRRCAGAMAHTTLICASGLLVFAASSFVPILHFAYLMVFLLITALVGDLILLPAILASPLGNFFRTRRGIADRETSTASPTDASHSPKESPSVRVERAQHER
ncbi:MAG: RND family transporter [Pirellulaceae bacterium]